MLRWVDVANPGAPVTVAENVSFFELDACGVTFADASKGQIWRTPR